MFRNHQDSGLCAAPSRLNEVFEDAPNDSSALLWVPLLSTLIIDEGDTETCFVAFSPLEIAVYESRSARSGAESWTSPPMWLMHAMSTAAEHCGR
jgi:hypothetical protein